MLKFRRIIPKFAQNGQLRYFISNGNPPNPSDTFGSLAESSEMKHKIDRYDFRDLDAEDEDGEAHFRAKIADTGRPRPHDFLKLIHDDLRRRDLKSALNRLHSEMKHEYVKPNEKHYLALINACSVEGYFLKAFELHREYKSRGFNPKQSIYADLFNACANAPNPKEALGHAISLKKAIAMDNFSPNKAVCHTMIKAFGMGGDLPLAFSVMDEMKREHQIVADDRTFAHLLIACISDRRHGFRHSVAVWRKMIAMKVRPNVHCFNLMLKAAKDCGAGDERFNLDLLLGSLSVDEVRKHTLKLLEGEKRERKLLKMKFSEIRNSELKLLEGEESEDRTELVPAAPNLLSKRPKLDGIVGLSELDKMQNRFLLLGGIRGFLGEMKARRINPDGKIFLQMLDLIEESEESELQLMNSAKELKVELNVIFYNALIRRRALRRDYSAGRNVLELMEDAAPDIVTYGVLALCARTPPQIRSLVDDIRRSGIGINNEIATALIRNAYFSSSPNVAAFIIDVCDNEQLKPNERLLLALEKFNVDFRAKVLRAEKGETEKLHKNITQDMNEGFPRWRRFRSTYEQWLKKAQVDEQESEHPWKQFITPHDVKRAKQGKDDQYNFALDNEK